ncbi:hypothetical protein [Sediminicoccus rosea]|uniref:Uncharacterized protein n=1 Tax=Sediminicoccus rosea TaxID=1225128 RepID=A0ABZ0PBU4_9PROT|nr:hypothetical protein [Sediminicoccus rosea]WPB83057.1 hypothetical protein R9Z33_13175 [Sediminicoccus rosea]
MIRRLALALMLAAPGLAAPGLAAAQMQDCVAAGLLAVDEVTYGTQRIPRDPNNPASRDQITLSVGVRNISPATQNFTAMFSAPPVQQDFLGGQRWTLAPGARTTIIVANVLRPAMSVELVRSRLRLVCG